MEMFVNDFEDFELGSLMPALRRWRSAITMVRNRRNRFRMVARLAMRARTEALQTQKEEEREEEEREEEEEEESERQMQDSTLNPVHMRGRPVRGISIDLIKAKLNILLPFGPLAILLHYLIGKHAWVFFFCLLGMSPLEERIGYVTKQLALSKGLTVGCLLNATFGSSTEMIISIFALKNGMIRVVQLSLLGSILSHMLLLLGCAFFASGIVHPQEDQVFDKELGSLGLLLMAVIGIFFPSVLKFTHTEVHFGTSELSLSRFISFILLVAYASCLLFQLKSQYNLRDPIIEERDNHAEDSDQEEAPEIVLWEAIGWLAILTVLQSIVSEYLIDSIQGASDSWNMSVDFISVILIPAAVCANTVVFAMQEKLDDTRLQSVIGFSTQILMFVIPFCVVVGWFIGMPMDLNFQIFETATLFITVLMVAFLLKERTSNLFKGLMLILCYFIVAASFFVHVDPSK